MPSWVYLVSEIGQMIVVVAVTSAALVALGALFYHVRLPSHTLVGLVVYVVMGTACFCALGLAVTRICTTTDAATAIGPFSTVILGFISGVFITVDVMPVWLLDISKLFPLEHLARGLQTAFLVPGSTGITFADLGVLAAWFAAGLLIAIRSFR